MYTVHIAGSDLIAAVLAIVIIILTGIRFNFFWHATLTFFFVYLISKTQSQKLKHKTLWLQKTWLAVDFREAAPELESRQNGAQR
jgi:hypothetical protein